MDTGSPRRVLVIGPGGAGKTTLALAIGEATGLPVVHLDTLYWRPGWVPAPETEWRRIVGRAVDRPEWVMDGNYSGTLDLRIPAADTIVFLDRSRFTCLWRLVKRRLSHRGRTRATLPIGCPERLTLEFLWWVWTYPGRRRAMILERLAAVREDTTTVILTNDAEAERFVQELRAAE